ncbi:hypothetical protein JHK85_006680 [Glycine max]|nr:hypothetical protein JHK85_006680 [Glycine max]
MEMLSPSSKRSRTIGPRTFKKCRVVEDSTVGSDKLFKKPLFHNSQGAYSLMLHVAIDKFEADKNKNAGDANMPSKAILDSTGSLAEFACEVEITE